MPIVSPFSCLHWASAPAPLAPVQLPSRAKAAVAKESVHLGEIEPVWTQHCIWTGQGQLVLVLAEAAGQKMSGALTGMLGPSQCTHWRVLGTRFSPSCSSAAPYRGEDAIAGRRDSKHTEGIQPACTWPSGLLLQHLGTCPRHLIGQRWPLSRGEAPANTWLWLKPLHLQLHLPPRW